MSARKWNGMQFTAVLARRTQADTELPRPSGCGDRFSGVGLLCSAPLPFDQTSHHGGEPCAGVMGEPNERVTSGNVGGADCHDDDSSGCVGLPTWRKGERESRLGRVSDLKQGRKAKWVGKSVLKLNFDLRPFPKMSLNVTLGELSAHRYYHRAGVLWPPWPPWSPARAGPLSLPS